jgi:hypothetical protein
VVVLIFIDGFMMNSIFLVEVWFESGKAFTEGNPFDFAQGKLITKIVNSGGYPLPSLPSFASVSLFTGAGAFTNQ